jgi:heat shock protein HtpX
MTNYAKIFGLMALMTALFVGVAGYFGGTSWMLWAFAFAAVFNFGSYWFSDRMVMKMYGAEKIGLDDHPELYEMVDRLRQQAGLPMPTVAIAPTEQPNAFATGRNPENAVVCFTEGILRALDREELEGVAAHELAHIKNRDMLVGTVSATLAAAVVMLARFGFFFGGGRDRGGAIGAILMIVLAPLAAMLIKMAISRAGEYRADRTGSEISGRPRALASALQSMQQAAERQGPMRIRRAGPRGDKQLNEAAAHLCIVNPLGGGGGGVSFSSLFSTHPPTEERVRRLEEMARGGA